MTARAWLSTLGLCGTRAKRPRLEPASDISMRPATAVTLTVLMLAILGLTVVQLQAIG